MGLAVDVVTPTLNRADKHRGLWESFDRQKWPDKRLIVLDESLHPSPFFGRLNDRRVVYVHAPNKKISGAGQGGIGRARNRLMRMTKAPLVAHFDDDDFYADDYLHSMADRLLGGHLDLVKLSVWNAILESDRSIWRWDARPAALRGKHFVIVGSQVEGPVEVTGEEADDPRTADWMLWGWGFSYVFRRTLWSDFARFPEDGTEDYPWLKRVRSFGARVGHVPDLAHLCLHTVHPRSQSAIFPQRRVAAEPTDEGWQELPSGKTIAVTPGRSYRVLACLKDKHTLRDIAARCAVWGLVIDRAFDRVEPESWGAAAPPTGYRLVVLVGSSRKSTTIPWRPPSILAALDKSTVVKAWRK